MAEPRFLPMFELKDLANKDYVNRNKINCIKMMRQITGEGLKETKEFFEQVWLPMINGTGQPETITKQSEEELIKRVDYLERKVREIATVITADKAKAQAKGIFDG